MLGGWNINAVVGAMPNSVATGWSQVFDKLIGASYIPLIYVGSQVVNGVNHAIIAEQELATINADKHIVKVVLNESTGLPNEKVFTIVSIETII